jgi:2-dehydro-3-deoxy-D-arabinonate dehydratase
MKFCSFATDSSSLSLGVLDREAIFDLTEVDRQRFANLNSLYDSANGDVTQMIEIASDAIKQTKKIPYSYERLRIPVKPSEIWAAGVTYLRSRQARESETKSKGLYDYVYEAKRPELFLKDSGLRCRGPGEEIGIRGDSNWNVPEPELTVLCDNDAKIIGFACGNDVSSRDIEGENPLYLPQAKVYRWSSAVGPVIVTPDELGDPHSLEIRMRIIRNEVKVFEGSTSTSQMKRRVPELLEFLKRDNQLETFTMLMTGTSIVPPDDFTLQTGDEVEVEIEKIGMLKNRVKKLSQ